VVDDFTRECLCLVADTSLSGARVARELDAVIARRARPLSVVSDNGTELTSMAILKWSQEAAIDWHYIAPGKPTQLGVHVTSPDLQGKQCCSAILLRGSDSR
jgi:putative transposase